MKIISVVGTRPEIIKMFPVIEGFKKAKGIEHKLIFTGQHTNLLYDIANELRCPPDIELSITPSTLSNTTAQILMSLEPVLNREKPALVLSQGDTTTVLATALTCSQLKIPFGHIEAGLRTYDFENPFPEEINRHLISRISSLNFVPTQLDANNLTLEKVLGEIHITGNTVIDTLTQIKNKLGSIVPIKNSLLVTVHRRENFGEPLYSICDALSILASKGIHIKLPVHPNPNIKDVVYKRLKDTSNIELLPPLGYTQMIKEMMSCSLILTDSGGIQEEAPSLNKMVLVLRKETERKEGIKFGTAKLIGTEVDNIVSETLAHLNMPATNVINPYGDGLASPRIIGICRTFLTKKNDR